jgi:hypothetical protein
VIIANLIELLSPVDLEIREALAPFVRFGDAICVHYVQANTLGGILETIDANDRKIMEAIVQWMPHCAVNASEAIRRLCESASEGELQEILESTGFAVKEKDLHTNQMVAVHFPPFKFAPITTRHTSTTILDFTTQADADRAVAYEICRRVSTLVGGPRQEHIGE